MYFRYLIICLSLAGAAQAAESIEEKEPIIVHITGVSGELAENVRANLSLLRPRQQADFSATWIKRLHRRAEKEIARALQPFGYYQPQITTALKAPAAPEQPWEAVYHILAGEPVRLSRVDVQISGEGARDPAFQAELKAFPLREGDVLRHAPYEQGKQALLDITEARGYFGARLTRHTIRVEPDRRHATLALHLDSGPRYVFGEVKFEQTRFAERFLQQFLTFQTGEPYLAEKLLDFRDRLTDSDYFQRVEFETQQDAAGKPPVIRLIVRLEPRRRDFYQGRLGYGTDSGVRAALNTGLRYVNRWGHRFNTGIAAKETKNMQVATLDYLIPRGGSLDNYWQVNLSHKGEDYSTLDAGFGSEDVPFGETRVMDFSITLSKHKDRTLFGTQIHQILHVSYLTESYNLFDLLFSDLSPKDQQDLKDDTLKDDMPALSPDYQVLYPGITWQYRHLGKSALVTRGRKLSLTLQGAREGWGSSLSFWQVIAKGGMSIPLGKRGRVLLRSEAAYTDAITTPLLEMNVLPQALQMSAGGDNSVRGYDYNELSDKAGKHMLVGSVEYEYRFLEKWGAAVFTDAGDAFNDPNDFSLAKGAGSGVRWYSPAGPVRLDLAFALDKPDTPWRIHLNIGADF